MKLITHSDTLLAVKNKWIYASIPPNVLIMFTGTSLVDLVIALFLLVRQFGYRKTIIRILSLLLALTKSSLQKCGQCLIPAVVRIPRSAVRRSIILPGGTIRNAIHRVLQSKHGFISSTWLGLAGTRVVKTRDGAKYQDFLGPCVPVRFFTVIGAREN